MSAGRQARIRKHCTDAGAAVFAVLLMIWTILPLYNMVRVALQEKEDVFRVGWGGRARTFCETWASAPVLTTFAPSPPW